jgi:alanyl-tRNA synthetase
MTIHEIRKAYLDFFAEKRHAILPSASVLPDNDPTTLFTGSGMQPMIPFLLGEPHAQGTRLADSQKCFRAQDIEEVGDNRHTTFFEMLGNWSLGDYFKQDQIAWMFEFLTKRVGLDPKNLYITAFRGNDQLGIPRDEEAVALWQAQFAAAGIDAKAVDFPDRDGMQGGRIFYYDEKKNWWSRSGVPSKMPVGEPGGPDTEMFWDFAPQPGTGHLHGEADNAIHGEHCHVNCDCGRFMEIGNNVFMEYQKTADGFVKLKQRNVDFGGGLERIAAALNNNPDVFLTSAFFPVIKSLETMSGQIYIPADVEGSGVSFTNIPESSQSISHESLLKEVANVVPNRRSFRIIADHIRAATFIIGDPRGVLPSNVGAGYVVRRLLRRAIREGRRLGIQGSFLPAIGQSVIEAFGEHYTELRANQEKIQTELAKEEEKFGKTLEKGLKELEKMAGQGNVSGEQAFTLFSTYGFPLELTEELLLERGMKVDREVFQAEFKKHQDLSRTSSAGAFKGGLADQSVETTRLHTATHLLHQALRTVLGTHVEQRGSNITAERLRFDFSHGQKVTPEELAQVEALVNEAIRRNDAIRMEEMTVEEAKSRGVIGLFEDKYALVGNKIKVYFMGDFSKEICGGPHVTQTGELGSFKIQKEEAVSAGVRRIKATVTG